MQNLLKTRNYPEVGFERDLRSIPAENLEQKVEKNIQQNRHRFSFRWILQIRFFKRVLNLWVPRFLVSNVHRSFGLQLDTFLGLKVEFSGDSGSYFLGRSKALQILERQGLAFVWGFNIIDFWGFKLIKSGPYGSQTCGGAMFIFFGWL